MLKMSDFFSEMSDIFLFSSDIFFEMSHFFLVVPDFFSVSFRQLAFARIENRKGRAHHLSHRVETSFSSR